MQEPAACHPGHRTAGLLSGNIGLLIKESGPKRAEQSRAVRAMQGEGEHNTAASLEHINHSFVLKQYGGHVPGRGHEETKKYVWFCTGGFFFFLFPLEEWWKREKNIKGWVKISWFHTGNKPLFHVKVLCLTHKSTLMWALSYIHPLPLRSQLSSE